MLEFFGTKPVQATPGWSRVRKDLYKQAGVDTDEANAGVDDIVGRVRATWPPHGLGRVVLPIGYFANVIEIDGIGIALCTDGVGSKTIIATMMDKYDTIGIDCVAMNVNDMICVGAKPISMVDYLAVETAKASVLDAIGAGLCEGARQAQISISGGETAQLKGIVKGFDLAGTAVGRVALDRILTGSAVSEGDIVIGVRSSGVHSNGLSMARRAFFDGPDAVTADHKFDDLEVTIGEELLRPTDIYVVEALEVLEHVPGVKALINITSDGLLNLTRVYADVSFEIDRLIEPHPVFDLIQKYADADDQEMFEVFNMGTGFCFVVAPEAAEQTIEILKRHGRDARRIGYAIRGSGKHVRILERALVGQHKKFWKDDTVTRRVG